MKVEIWYIFSNFTIWVIIANLRGIILKGKLLMI